MPSVSRFFTAGACALLIVGCGGQGGAAGASTGNVAKAEEAGVSLGIVDVKEGTGEAIVKGQTAVVHYTGWLFDTAAAENKGRKFDSSRDRNDPFAFEVGAGEVIKGWDQGVAGMKVGGQRRLVIPADLGYGSRGAGGVIPGGATLVFDVELVGIE